VGGTAAKMAAEQVLRKARHVSGEMLGVDAGELRVRHGALVPDHAPEKRATLAQIATECFSPRQIRTGEETGLVGRATYVAEA
jgi:Molybdopterin-binding domain of aldehyde dehydrogenase